MDDENEENNNSRNQKSQDEGQFEGLLSLARNDDALQQASAHSPHRALLFC